MEVKIAENGGVGEIVYLAPEEESDTARGVIESLAPAGLYRTDEAGRMIMTHHQYEWWSEYFGARMRVERAEEFLRSMTMARYY